MKSFRSVQNGYKFKNQFLLFAKDYKVYFIILLIVVILGVFTGSFTASKYSADLQVGNIPDNNFVNFLNGNKGSFGLFFSYYIWYSLLIVSIIFLNNNIVFNILTGCVLFILGYRVGFTISTLISLFSFAGILNCVIIIIPFEIILFIILITISCVAIRRSKNYNKYGCRIGNINYTKVYILLYVLFTLVLFVMCLVLPVIRATIII